MPDKDKAWSYWVDAHKDMSVQDLESVKTLAEMMYNMGELAGLERGQEIMARNSQTMMNLLSNL